MGMGGFIGPDSFVGVVVGGASVVGGVVLSLWEYEIFMDEVELGELVVVGGGWLWLIDCWL